MFSDKAKLAAGAILGLWDVSQVSRFTRLHRGIVDGFGHRACVVSVQQGSLRKIVIRWSGR